MAIIDIFVGERPVKKANTLHTDGRDKLFAEMLDGVESFVFDERVARVFPDMIRRSVPGYYNLVSLIGVVAAKFATPGSCVYDLGCSLGAVTASMISSVGPGKCRFVAVDSSGPMIERCRSNLEGIGMLPDFEAVESDIRSIDVSNASVVVLNYTLQFIPVDDRPCVLEAICKGLNPGGALILSEKIVSEHTDEQVAMECLHEAFKKANGYDDLEISRKRSALEKVLVPETAGEHVRRLRAAGFTKVYQWFQCVNFHSFIAIKP